MKCCCRLIEKNGLRTKQYKEHEKKDINCGGRAKGVERGRCLMQFLLDIKGSLTKPSKTCMT